MSKYKILINKTNRDAKQFKKSCINSFIHKRKENLKPYIEPWSEDIYW